MKLLRNPVVVGVLAVLAVAFVLHAFWPALHLGGSSGRGMNSGAVPVKAPAVSEAVPASPAPATVDNASAPASATGSPVWVDSQRWMETPRRNPFWSPNAVSETGPEKIVTAAEKLSLSSVLLQTGNSVAVVNDHVVSEGDTVEGYRIETIEADRIWVSGPNGRESVGFKADLPARPRTIREPVQEANSSANSNANMQ